MNEEPQIDYVVTVEKAWGAFWVWHLSVDGKSKSWGVSLSENEARLSAAEAIESRRQMVRADHAMGTILG